jgi:hypothetical protein
MYIEKLNTGVSPSFNTFYEFIEEEYKDFFLQEKQVREKNFALANFLNVLEPYYKMLSNLGNIQEKQKHEL